MCQKFDKFGWILETRLIILIEDFCRCQRFYGMKSEEVWQIHPKTMIGFPSLPSRILTFCAPYLQLCSFAEKMPLPEKFHAHLSIVLALAVHFEGCCMARDVRWCSQSKPWVIWRTVLVLEYSCLPENQVFMHCFRISRWAISYLLTIPNTPNGIPYCSSILTFPRQWLWKNFHEILNSKFLNWEYSTLTTEVVFSFGGINVLPTLLVDFHSRGVLARALVSFTWRSYLFIIFFYVAWQRRDQTCQDGRAGWANVTAIYGHAILI